MEWVPKKENRKSFFKRLDGKVSAVELKMLQVAYVMAKYGHQNQKREGGERYFEHVRGTAIILMDELKIFLARLIIEALVHDILEDSWLLDEDSMTTLFGRDVTATVSVLTKPHKNDPRFTNDHERHVWYFERLKNSSAETKLVKLADRLHNMRTLGACSPEKQSRKIKETRDIYFPLIVDIAKVYPEKAEYLCEALEEALVELKK